MILRTALNERVIKALQLVHAKQGVEEREWRT